MVRAAGLLSLLSLAFTLYCLLDVVLTDGERVRNLPKATWVVIVLVLPVVGGIVWLLGGRPAGGTARPGGPDRRPPGRDHPAGSSRRAPKGPDDDPDFLRRLDEELRREDPDDEDQTS